MTGAPIPPGANALVMIEDGMHGLARQEYIRKKGENISLGERALSKGDIITPASCALAATIGYSTLPVRSKLRIAIIPTGDELTQPGLPLEPGKIYESNSVALASLVRKAGAEPIVIKPTLDDKESLHDILDRCAKEVDLILTSGGVSMGEKDFIRSSLIDRGAAIFWKVPHASWRSTNFWSLEWNSIIRFTRQSSIKSNSIPSPPCAMDHSS